MATKMVDMGLKRKDLHPIESGASPKSEKDYAKEKVYPEMSLDGAHAEMMGADDLKEGDVVTQTVQWRVKRHSKTTENGKTDFRMTLCLEKASDCEEAEGADGEDAEDGDAAEKGDTPAMAYIRGSAKNAD